MKTQALTPVKLRLILIVLLLLLAGAGVGVFAYGYGQLKTHASIAQTTATEAEASRSSLQNLITTKQFLADNADVVNRASQLSSESKLYVYQDQIISDINAYASQAGIEVTNINFEAPVSTTVAAPAATATPAADTTATAATAAAPTNVKSTTATVTIKSPTSYNSMLTFIHLIEQSLFRMQISKVGMSQSTGSDDAGSITSDTLTIEAYIR